MKKNGYERKKSLSLHIAVDAKSKKVVSFRITKGNVRDARKFGPLVREAAEKCDIDKVQSTFETWVSRMETAQRCGKKMDS